MKLRTVVVLGVLAGLAAAHGSGGGTESGSGAAGPGGVGSRPDTEAAAVSELVAADGLLPPLASDRPEGPRPPSGPRPPWGPRLPSGPPAPAPAEVAAAEPAARSFTMAFSGDFLLHQPVNAAAAAHAAAGGEEGRGYDYRPLLEPIRPWIEGVDWAVCHMEVNLSADGTRLASYPSFRAPGRIAADAADIGYDGCTTASNHTLDHGADGVAETLGALEDAGLRFTGSARSPEEAAESIFYEIGGVQVAHLAYSYWFNGIPVPEGMPWLVTQIDEARILADAEAARAAGSEYVIVSLHWGEQYQNQPTAQQRELGPRLLRSPAIDLIIGHHAHVVQPIDRINGEWLVYGLGNLLANHTRVIESDELLVTIAVTERDDDSFDTDLEVIPLHVDRATMTVHPSRPGDRPPDLSPGLAEQLDASLARVTAVLETGSGWIDLDPGRWPAGDVL